MIDIKDIKTTGIKYTGSKLKLLPYIYDNVKDLNINTVLDGFAGTTRVSQMFAQMDYVVTSVDKSIWSKTFGNCFLKAKKDYQYYQEIIDELNNLPLKKGWFTETYSINNNNKSPFQDKNLMKLDSIREYIEKQDFEEEDKDVLLTSLILGLDKVDNTLGHFASYLQDWSPRSSNDLILKVPEYKTYEKNHIVIQDDIFNVLKNNNYYDLCYYDPPYGSNCEKMPSSRVRYESYYHFWKTVILYDSPNTFGKANRREDSRDLYSESEFEKYKKDKDGKYYTTIAIEKLIKNTNSKYILFSYSNGGRTTKDQLNDIFVANSKDIKILEINYKSNVMMSMTWTNEWNKDSTDTKEYLFLLEKK